MFDSFNPNKNPMFWANWIFVALAIMIFWKYRASGAFWMGVFAVFIFGMRITVNCNSNKAINHSASADSVVPAS